MCLNLCIFLNTNDQWSLLLKPRDSVFLLHSSSSFMYNITKTSSFFSLNISGFWIFFSCSWQLSLLWPLFWQHWHLTWFPVPYDYLFFLSPILLPDYCFLNPTFLLSSILLWKLPNNSLSPGCIPHFYWVQVSLSITPLCIGDCIPPDILAWISILDSLSHHHHTFKCSSASRIHDAPLSLITLSLYLIL